MIIRIITEYLKFFKYFLIKLLAGDMPVVLNMNISKPKGFSGMLVYYPYQNKDRLFCNNVLLGKQHTAILTPTRDVKLSGN